MQIVLFLAVFFSLRLNDFFVKNSFANSENSHSVTTSAQLVGGHLLVCPADESSIELPSSSFSPGFQILDFQVNRTTFGFVDANFTQPFNPNLANRKVALGCDSIEMSLVAVLSGISASDSVGFKITYSNPNGTTSANEVFLFDEGQAIFTNGGSNFTCPVSPSAMSVTSSQGTKTLHFNLHNCLIGLGLNLQPGDTLRFVGKFSVNPNGPLPNVFSPVPNLAAHAFAIQNGSSLSCDTLTETFTLGKNEVVFDFPNTLNGLPIGCNEGALTWRVFVPNNYFSDWFGNELRPAAKVDSLVFDFDPGLATAFAGGQVEVSLPGHPVHGSSHFPIRPLSDFPDGHYVARFDTLASVTSLNVVQTYIFDLRVKLTPTCKSSIGSAALNNIYNLQSAVSYADRYYARYIGDGNCVSNKTDLANSVVAYTQPPTFTLNANTPAAATPTNGLVTWDLAICNTSGQTGSGANWLAVEAPTGLLTVTSIANITNPGNPVQLALLPYGQHVFAFTPGVNAGQCLVLRVTATTTNCDDLNLQAKAGWNCKPYPTGWTPNDNAPCSSNSLALSVQHSGVLPIQTNFTAVTSTCNGAGEEVSVAGNLSSTLPLASASYTLSFVWDENGDGNVQANETVVGQQVVTGGVSVANPVIFNQLLQVQADQSCQLLLKIETSGSGGCSSQTSSLPIPQILNVGDDLTFCNTSSLFTTTFGVGAACDALGYQHTWSAIAPASLGHLSAVNIPNPVLTINPVNHLGQTLRYVLATERLTCGVTTFDTIQVIVPSSATGVFASQQLNLQVPNCQALATVCAEVPVPFLPNYFFTDNGLPYTGGFPVCGIGIGLQVGAGMHQLIATDTVLGCSDTVLVTVNCTTTDTLQVALLIGESDTICVNSNQLSGAIVALTNVCQDGQFVGYQMINDSCLVLTGNLVGQETACLVACDAFGNCDTTLVTTTVSHPFPNGIFDTITLTQSGLFCFDEDLLNITGILSSIQNICPNSAGNAVGFDLDSVGFCIEYVGLSVGTSTACIELCDDLGNCDTINFQVTVVPGSIVYDTVFLLLETDTFCLPQGWLPGNVVSILDVCPENNGDNVSFNVLGNCILYNGFAVGADTACFRFEDVFGNVALVELRIFVRKTTPETYCDTIFVGQTKLYCLDVSELPGPFANGSIREICPDERTDNVELVINQSGRCVFYEGLKEGRDSACIVFCDQFGFCDTTYLCLLVKPYFDPPTLGPDTTTTIKGTPVVIDFLANDTIFGGIVDLYVLDEPISGSVVLNLDNSFTYVPDNPFCARWDNFTYVACNPNGCDTTTVSIFIECIELTIFTAVSPNNDGVNDFFYIAKIEEFPDNHLWVYNIWGSLVYEATAYRNNWPGTWGADTDLPDGTYYYMLEWTDNGVTTVQKGFMELFR